MNGFTTRAWLLAAASLGMSAVASAQSVPPPLDYEFICDDVSTTGSNYSADFAIVRQRNDLFAFTIGTSGTVNFEECFTDNGFTANVAGRIGFGIGRIGSIQDESVYGIPIDDDLQLQAGMPYGVGGNWGYAKLVKEDDAGVKTFTALGDDDDIDGFFTGASDRYSQIVDEVDGVDITLRADLIGDATRLQWTLTNGDADATRVGLWFGQWVVGRGPQTTFLQTGMHYVRVPGKRPLETDTRFRRNPRLNVFPVENPMPPVLEFGLTQAWAFGLQVVTLPTEGATSALADQTPCDGLDVGDAGVLRSPSLLGSMIGNDRPMNETFSALWEDVTFTTPLGSPVPDGSGYIQMWDPILVGGNNSTNRSRTIIAYYKSTTGVSDYAKPYSAVVDGPRTIGVLDNNPNQFNPATSAIRVYIDNTRGFSTIGQNIPLNDVRITLDLPQGLSDATDPSGTRTRITKFIDRVEPNDANIIDPSLPIAFVDFQVNVSPNVFGTQFYRVTIEPQPGPKKVINASINVATQPRLLIREQANLVTAPWQFVSTNWATILGSGPDPLQPDVDYQAFTWDAEKQEYVLQLGPQRGKGTFLVSTRNVGFKQLDGTPRTPSDLATGAPLIQLKSGWNLIANPYNYPIEVGQIVGVTATDPTDALTYAELVEQGIVSASLAWWDQNTQSYKFTTNLADELVPNRGYWVFVSTVQDLTLNFPPVFTPFVPRGTGGIQQSAGWKLNLVTRTSKGLDDQNFIGIAANQAQALATRIMEPPIAPMKGAVSATITEGNLRLAQSLKPKAARMEWLYSVTPRSNGIVTVTWPDASQVPSNVRLRAYDVSSGASYDMRWVPSVSFFGKANRVQQYRIVAEDATASSVLSSATVSATRTLATVKYTLGDSATTGVRILQSGRLIRTVTSNRADTAGAKTLTWNLRDAANRRVRGGVFVAEVTAKTIAGRIEKKTVSFLVR